MGSEMCIRDRPSADIQAAARDGSTLWIGTPGGVSQYNGARWTVHNPGLASSNIRAIASHPTANEIYVGANDFALGGVSRYDGRWHPLPDFNGSRPNTVQALLVDSAGRLWIGTDSGVSRCMGSTCNTYTTDDGLGSNNVVALAEGIDGDIWLATWSYVSPQGTRGGVSRYDSATGAWHWYTPADGLPVWDVAAVTVDDLGRVWFGTWGGGVSLFDERTHPPTWTTFNLPSNNVRSLALDSNGTIWAGTSAGLVRFYDNTLATAPMATINQVSPAQATQGVDSITFAGSRQDGIVGYEWRSDLDGPLSTSPSFSLEAGALSAGTHRITFRVQDMEGAWSQPAEAMLVVKEGWRVFLPLVVR